MAETIPITLRTIPVVRRVEYLDAFLDGVSKGWEKRELEAAIGERKKNFELEKNLALGRGKPYQKKITEAVRLQRYCLRLGKDLGFVEKIGSKVKLLDKGRTYSEADEKSRMRILGEAYSEAYPHLSAIVLALNRLKGEAVLPLMNKPPIRPEITKYGINIDQVSFDTVRDIGTRLGLINWYVTGSGADRRQHVYSTCAVTETPPRGDYLFRLNHRGNSLFAIQNKVERNGFKAALWDTYLTLANGVPGFPIFYSLVREQVCAALRIRDDQFDSETMNMVDWDEALHVIWSEGVLPYQQDTASMLKSLPPKNEWGRYVVYLKIVRK
jgi:hypothetical protein